MATDSGYLKQAAAIPVKNNKICLVTTSNGKRWIVPKGLIDPGHTASEAALNEAWEEAGLVGVLQPEPVGTYLYSKMGSTYHVVVFLMQVTEAAEDWPERTLRQRAWVSVDEALEEICDAGLRELIEAATAVA
ncbi:MAG TPA: NUDIX hydrolase [Gemmataceae bacterium]|nr:NUDIX hydrolase [Gemmataceae bacterium]